MLLKTWTLFSWVSWVTDHDVIVTVNDPHNEVIAYNGVYETGGQRACEQEYTNHPFISMHSMVMARMV